MPAVITDPSLNPGVVNQSSSIFDYPDTPAPSVLNFQVSPSQPLPGGTETATGLISPDLLFDRRLRNFPDQIFDLSPGSSLTHFLQSMLGDSGVGQLRKRQLIARLQAAVTSTHFYDLDAFYGALFGSLRGPDGAIPVNPATGHPVSPYADLASPDGWDDLYAIDALFRERIIALARAITLGGTLPGLQALAEAITGVPCKVTEIWKLIDAFGAQAAPSKLWSQLQASYPHWSAIGSQTWQQIEGILVYGGMGINARNEVLIQPHTQYGPEVASQAQQSADMYGISRVTEVLKPSFTLLSVSPQAALVNVPVSIISVWADSDYWEIVPHVTPKDLADPAYAKAITSYQTGGGPVGATFPQPVPPFSQSQGTQYSYVSDITTAWAQAGDLSQPADFRDYQTENFTSGTVQYLPLKAAVRPDRATTVRASSAVAVKAAPYSGPRVSVMGTS